MSSEFVYLTAEGYKKLNEELEFLKNVRRRQISKALEEARGHGDISENAEYDAAKEAQALNEKKIAELEDKLARARILEYEDIPDDEVRIGARVSLRDEDSGDEFEYIFVSEAEADYAEGKISITSPIGKALVGHKVGETVEIQVPAGTLRYTIKKITR